MSTIGNVDAARGFLRRLTNIVKSTRRILREMAQQVRYANLNTNQWGSPPLTDALEHVEDVREGFVLSQRVTPPVDMAELRGIVRHVLLKPNWWEDLGLTFIPPKDIIPLKHQLIAYNHAIIALAVLPRLPAQVITFPQPRPTYADVTVPVQPGDILLRIEEIERIIYQIEVMATKISIDNLAYHAFRRTYAFFEASEWLMTNHLQAMLDA